MPNPWTRGRASQHFDRMVVLEGLEPSRPEGHGVSGRWVCQFPYKTMSSTAQPSQWAFLTMLRLHCSGRRRLATLRGVEPRRPPGQGGMLPQHLSAMVLVRGVEPRPASYQDAWHNRCPTRKISFSRCESA